MVQTEELEMNAHRAALESDVRHLVVMQFCLAALNIRAARKTSAAVAR